jgi:hypothetical protein
MKSILLVLCAFGMIQAAWAQGNGSYKITLNGKAIVAKRSVGNEAPSVAVAARDLKAANTLQIQLNGSSVMPEWKRVFILLDEQGNEIKKMENNQLNGRYDWRINDLKAILAAKGSIQVYTYGFPRDESQGALIRVARFHLVTLTLKK